MTTTDADGRFEMKELLAGRYSVTATKAGYVTMQYGQRRPEQQGTMLEILDGQLVEKIAFSLPRGGVIVGRVLDEFGEPMAGAQVSALRSRFVERRTPARAERQRHRPTTSARFGSTASRRATTSSPGRSARSR